MIPRATSVDNAIADQVQAWFDASIKEEPRDVTDRIHSAIGSVTYVEKKSDPAGSALTFILSAVKHFHKMLPNAAVDVHEHHLAEKEIAGRGRRHDSHRRGREEDEASSSTSESDDDAFETPQAPPRKKRTPPGWVKPCLNPKCSEKHMISDCTNTAPELKKELFDKHRASRSKNAEDAEDEKKVV